MARPPHHTWVQGNSAGPYSSPVDKFLFHTTEGSSIAGAVAAYRAKNSWPHLTVDARIGRTPEITGHLDLDVAARSLRNKPGGVETNTDGIVQIEVVGNAANPSAIDWAYIGREVVGPICHTLGIPIHSTVRWVPYPASYGLFASQRLSQAEWTAYRGLLGHEHAPENCVQADTPVLTADLRWVPAGSLQPGDEVVGFDEDSLGIGSTQGRRFRTAVVEANSLFEADAWDVTTPQGTVTTTGDHPWLVSLPYVNRGVRTQWVESQSLDRERHQLYTVGSPWQIDESHDAGYFAGLLDADGHVNVEGAIGFGQVPGEVLDWFIGRMAGEDVRIAERGVRDTTYSKQRFVDVWVKGGFWNAAGIIGAVRPRRLLTRMMSLVDGRVVGKTTSKLPILDVRQSGRAQMAGLQTSTGTFLADGLLVHNTHGDPGAIPIAVILDAAGAAPPPTSTSLEDLMPFPVVAAPVGSVGIRPWSALLPGKVIRFVDWDPLPASTPEETWAPGWSYYSGVEAGYFSPVVTLAWEGTFDRACATAIQYSRLPVVLDPA